MYININDIIRINQEVGEQGELHNSGSLEYALSIIKERKSWMHELAFIIRSLLADHAFRDGNKRTALAIMLAYIEDKGFTYDEERAVHAVYQISKKSITDINKIARVVKSVINS
jgi:prophage maintenance system killer protein